jgi:Copper transport outer membrane protein, MctB
MIDFRYHLVSIVAVFLALAIGLVLGATQLQPETTRFLDNQSNTEKHQIDSLQAQDRNLQSQIRSAQQFAQASAPDLLAGRLSGQRVVLVTAPGADSAIVTGVSTALAQAGAKVTGQVALQPAFFDTSAKNESSLDDLAQQLAPAGFVPVNPTAQLSSDANIAAQNQAAQVIAAALVTTVSPAAAGQPAQDTADPPAAQILTGLANQGFLQVTPASGATTLEPATLAVVVIPSSPPAAGDTDPDNLALISLAYQLRVQSHGVVVAGPLTGSGAGSAIDELINGNTGVQLSSVDDADAEQGQISVAEALYGLLAGQRPQAYGVGTGVLPAPGPDPAPSPTPTPSKTPAKSKSGG